MEQKNMVPYEPKKKNRYTIIFPEQFNSVYPFINKFTRPKWNKGKWSKFEVTLLDPVCPSMSQNIVGGLRKIKEIDSLEQKFIIEGLGPVGDTVEQWVILGKISKIKFSNVNYDINSKNLSKIKITIKPHTVILNY